MVLPRLVHDLGLPGFYVETCIAWLLRRSEETWTSNEDLDFERRLGLRTKTCDLDLLHIKHTINFLLIA